MNQGSLKLEATKNGMFSFPWTISLPIKSLPKNPLIVVASLSVQQLHLILGLAYSLLRFSSCLPTPLANFVHACRKLVLYPNRNKSKSEEENICLYLAMTDISSLPLGCEVYVIFLLVLLVQNKGKNLIVQGCYFHNLVTSQYCFVKHVHLICYSVSCLAQMPWEREDGLTNWSLNEVLVSLSCLKRLTTLVMESSWKTRVWSRGLC